jgi:hypothetical protein
MRPIIEDRLDLVELVNRLRFIAQALKKLPNDQIGTGDQVEKLFAERKLILTHLRKLRPFRRQRGSYNQNKVFYIRLK